VNLALCVQVVEAFEDLADYYGDVGLFEGPGLHEVEGRASAQILHDDPELGALEEGTVVLGDVDALTLGEDLDLLLNVLDFVFGLFQVDDLDSDNAVIVQVDSLENLAEGAAPDLLLLGEAFLRVGADFVVGGRVTR